jgi:DNA (cytosine-5)-methyltransferase 1
VVYYNEYDKSAAAWLRELIKENLIAKGEVDERSIIDVEARDLIGYRQHHFFAGIGGWSYALRIAGWPDDRPVWTASLPCQPFSVAGKQLGKSDERHLLPHFIELVRKCNPATLFGEQVTGAIKHGWIDDLYAEMEDCGYACGAVIAGAHSVGAAHIRQRLYWVADSISEGLQEQPGFGAFSQRANGNEQRKNVAGSCWMVNASGNNKRRNRQPQSSDGQQEQVGGSGVSDRLGVANSARSQQRIEAAETARHGGSVESAGSFDLVADTISKQRKKQQNERSSGLFGKTIQQKECVSGFSDICPIPNIGWLYCRDGKYRPIESGIKPLVDGVPRGMVHSGDQSAPINANATQEARAMRLRGYGNAIVPKLAAQFIESFMEIITD